MTVRKCSYYILDLHTSVEGFLLQEENQILVT